MVPDPQPSTSATGRPLRLVLASGSDGRLETLRRAGLAPDVIVSGVDETVDGSLPPAKQALQLAERKAVAVAATLSGPALVLGCDSMLELDGEVFGKPVTAEIAAQRWRRHRGRVGVLHTGHCVIDRQSARQAAATGSTSVHFAELTDEEIDAYVATGEPLGVAGAFTVDGLGGPFVTGIEGDHHNVVGVSLPLLRDLLAELGVSWPALWR